MMNKSLGVTLLVASVNAIVHKRLLQDKLDSGEAASADDSADPGKEVPFIETAAFIAIVVVGAVFLCCCLTCLTCSVTNQSWVTAKRKELEAQSEVAKTSKGDIEYRKWGNAPYMLLMPGTPGNCQSSVGFHQYGFGLITVSRPGYGQTPLTENNRTAGAQADLIMALMDHIGIDKLPVLAASGAGVVALRMAIQYPDRVQCLLMCCATTGSYKYRFLEEMKAGAGKDAATSNLTAKYGAKLMPMFAKKVAITDIMTANEEGTGKPGCITEATAAEWAEKWYNDPLQKSMVEQLAIFPALGACWPETFWEAMLVDMEYYQEKIPFEQVTVPVHMIHGDCDNDIPYTQAVQAKAGIPHAILITQPNGSHSL